MTSYDLNSTAVFVPICDMLYAPKLQEETDDQGEKGKHIHQSKNLIYQQHKRVSGSKL